MLFFWFFKNYELIRDSSLWRSNFIPLVHDFIIIIGSRSVTYTFSSRFTYKRWVRVLSKIWILAFLGKYSNIFVGSQSVSIEGCIIWYQSTGFKICFLSLLSFVSCYHPILFLLCSLFFVLILWHALGQNCAPSFKKKKKKKCGKKKDFRKEIENKKKIYIYIYILFVVSILSNQNIIFFCPPPLI